MFQSELMASVAKCRAAVATTKDGQRTASAQLLDRKQQELKQLKEMWGTWRSLLQQYESMDGTENLDEVAEKEDLARKKAAASKLVDSFGKYVQKTSDNVGKVTQNPLILL